MDKAKALELLKEYMGELEHLRTLHYKNDERWLWKNKVNVVLEVTFGKESDEYIKFNTRSPITILGLTDAEEQRDYLNDLKHYELSIREILQKYEILGIARERDKGGKVEKMNKNRLIDFLKGKIEELSHLKSLSPDNKDFAIWCTTIEGVLLKKFGEESFEYKTFTEAGILRGLVEDMYTQYRKAVKSREEALTSIINTLETLEDEEPLITTTNIESPVQLFDAMQFHPRIVKASKSLFHSGHYAEAIFAACKAINNFTKRKAGQSLDGKDLMAKVFNEDKPIIKLNKLTTQSERDEQEGFRFLFMGAMVGIRNPKAHDDIRQIDPYKTLEYLAFLSLLMRRATEGKLEPKESPL